MIAARGYHLYPKQPAVIFAFRVPCIACCKASLICSRTVNHVKKKGRPSACKQEDTEEIESPSEATKVFDVVLSNMLRSKLRCCKKVHN